MKTILDRDGGDVRLHRRDHRLHPARDVVIRIVLFLVRFLRHGHDVHFLRHAINRAHEVARRCIEPERADRDVPFGLTRANTELAQLDALPTGKLEADGISRLVRVVRLGTCSERMNYLVFVDVRLGEISRDPERLTSRSVRNVAPRAKVDVFAPYPLEHREGTALAFDIDDRAVAALPHHVRRSLTPHQQPVASDTLESDSHRHALVGIRVIAGEARILAESRVARMKEQLSGARILERACEDCRRDGQLLGKTDFFSGRVPGPPTRTQRIAHLLSPDCD